MMICIIMILFRRSFPWQPVLALRSIMGSPDKFQFQGIVKALAEKYQLDMPEDELLLEANKWEFKPWRSVRTYRFPVYYTFVRKKVILHGFYTVFTPIWGRK